MLVKIFRDSFHFHVMIVAYVWSGSLQLSLHPQLFGRVRKTEQAVAFSLSSTIYYMEEKLRKEACDQRSTIIEERWLCLEVISFQFIYLFIILELNLSVFAVCPLSYMKHFHTSSYNSLSWNWHFFSFKLLVSAKSRGGILGIFVAL